MSLFSKNDVVETVLEQLDTNTDISTLMAVAMNNALRNLIYTGLTRHNFWDFVRSHGPKTCAWKTIENKFYYAAKRFPDVFKISKGRLCAREIVESSNFFHGDEMKEIRKREKIDKKKREKTTQQLKYNLFILLNSNKEIHLTIDRVVDDLKAVDMKLGNSAQVSRYINTLARNYPDKIGLRRRQFGKVAPNGKRKILEFMILKSIYIEDFLQKKAKV